MLHEVKIAGFTIDPSSNTPILILQSNNGEHSIPIWIGILEATAIVTAIQKINLKRPMTHDLIKNILDKLQVNIDKIEINDLNENTFFAKIFFASKNTNYNIDARPSDAIAIAIRYNAPIYVDNKVLEKFDVSEKQTEIFDDTEEGKKWAKYLEKLTPQDFGKYKI
jgi:bifunctional DNase/RNase